MYQAFYQLTKEPFRLTPNSANCFRHKSFNKAKSYFRYAIHRREGLVMVTGDPGTGKTSLVADFLSDIDQKGAVGTLVVNEVEAQSLLPRLACALGMDTAEVDISSKAHLLQGLEAHFKNMHRQDLQPLLIVDEAQNLSARALEELRLLTTVQVGNYALMQFFLVGQNSLREKILAPELEQLRQRILAACKLEPLDVEETADYILAQLKQAGWSSDKPIFGERVLELIHRFSLGNPRWINQICSRLLLHGMVEEKLQLDASDLRVIVQDMVNEDLLPVEVRDKTESLCSEIEERQEHEEQQEVRPAV